MISKTKKLVNILRRGSYLRALLKGCAAGVEHEAVLSDLVNCKTIIDIGANRGQFALAAREICPMAIIYSFEPLDTPAKIFRRVFSHDDRVILHRYAIGPCRDTVTIHISHRDDSSSLLPISSVQSELFPGTEESGTTDIQVVPLGGILSEDELKSPTLLKLDVQGFELAALRGCEPFFSLINYIYVECSFVELYTGQAFASEIIQFLSEHGFGLGGVYNVTYDRCGRSIQADFLFSRL